MQNMLEHMKDLVFDEPELSTLFTFDRKGQAITLGQFIDLYKTLKDSILQEVKALSELTPEEVRAIALSTAQLMPNDKVLVLGIDQQKREDILASLRNNTNPEYLRMILPGKEFLWKAVEKGKVKKVEDLKDTGDA